MSKTFILLCLASSLGCNAFAQTGYKTWSPNGLTWTDFAAHPDLTQSRMSWFAYLIGYKPHKTRLHDTIIQYPQAYGVMNQLDSWVKSEAKNQDMLFYNQTAFNLVELSTRKVQAEMNRTHYFNLAEIPEPKRGVIFSKTKYIFETQVEKAKQRMQQFEEQTQYGTNTAAVTLWAKQIQAELNELPMASVPNDLNVQKFRFGLFLGGGVGTLQGNLKTYFDQTLPLMDFGLDLGYGRYQFTLETAGTMNNSQLLQPLTFNDVTYAKGLGVDFTWVQLTAGYAILDRPYWRIAPYAGFAVTSIAQSIAKKNASIRDSYSVIAGISADYKFRKKIILGEARNGIFYEQSLKMRIGLNNVILSQDLYGANGIATLSYCTSLSGVQ